MAVIIFCCIAGKVLLADYRRLLINGLNLGQPSFVYAYLALLVQSGMLIGILLFSILFIISLVRKLFHFIQHFSYIRVMERECIRIIIQYKSFEQRIIT